MPIWSKKCINPDAGFDLVTQKDGSITMQPRKYGYFVMTVEESKKVLEERK